MSRKEKNGVSYANLGCAAIVLTPDDNGYRVTGGFNLSLFIVDGHASTTQREVWGNESRRDRD